MRRRVLLSLLLALGAASSAHAAPVPENADYFQATFPSRNGATLHADVLRPKGLPRDARTPVVLTVSPYTGHSGPTGPSSAPEYDPTEGGPSDRFADLLEGARLLDRGFTYVMVDLQGFGGSTGCNDWGGPREQGDVVAAVEWAARQPFSTGRVALYGKSYDAWTGLMGLVHNPRGLAAVVAMEPVYDGYRYLYSDGVRFSNSFATPALFQSSDALNLNAGSGVEYALAGLQNDPGCLLRNYVDQQDTDGGSPFWSARALIPRAGAARAPLLLTQGFLEDNTKPDGAFDFFARAAGPKRAWFGQFDHIRPSDLAEDGQTVLMGRDPQRWWDEVARFLDHHVREVPLVDAPTDRDAPVVVGASDGTWRGETSWPPADGQAIATALRPGTYVDDGRNEGTGPNGGRGTWTFSPPLSHRAHLAGVPKLWVDVARGVDRANLVAGIYDVDAEGRATLVSRGARLVSTAGRHSVEMYGQDWVFEAGHRVGVLISGSNAEWWQHRPTLAAVDVSAGRVTLPWLTYARAADESGGPPVKLGDYRRDAPFPVAADEIAQATSPSFALPGPLQAAPAPAVAPAPATPTRARATRRLVARLGVRGRRVTVLGNAPPGARVRVVLRRGAKTVARRTARARLGAFRVTIRVRRAGRYRALVSTRTGGRTLRARTPVRRIR